MPEKITLDLDELTIGEIIAIEMKTEVPFDELFQEGKPKGLAFQAAAWIVKRREDPAFTFEQALDLTIDFAEPDPLENGS